MIFWASALFAVAHPCGTVVVVNEKSAASKLIANEYVRLRKIPASNVVYLSGIENMESIKVGDFRNKILNPVLKTLADRELLPQINTIVYSTDFPYSVNLSEDTAGINLPKVLSATASINSATYFAVELLFNPKALSYLNLEANQYAAKVPLCPGDTKWKKDEMESLVETSKLLGVYFNNKEDKSAQEGLDNAGKILMNLLKFHPDSASLYLNLATYHIGKGETKESLTSLEKAAGYGFSDFQGIQMNPVYAPLEKEIGFDKIIDKIKINKCNVESSKSFPYETGHFLSTMLAYTAGRGNTVDEALSYLRRSVEADGSCPKGTIYFMKNKDVRSTTREWALQSASEKLNKAGIKAEVLDGILPEKKDDVAGLLTGIPNFSWEKSGSKILPGALCEHFTSAGGILKKTDFQTPLTEFLKYGAAGASGTVVEPYAIQAKFPTAFIQLYYAQGSTLAEAYYQSVTCPYQLLIVGDALCNPWARKIDVKMDLKDGDTVKGELEVRPSATSKENLKIKSFEFYLDGRRIGRTSAHSSAYKLNSANFADGNHELQVHAIADDSVESRGTTSRALLFKNKSFPEFKIKLISEKVKLGDKIQIDTSCESASEILFFHNSREIGRIPGTSGKLEIDSALIGQGTVKIFSKAVFKSETGTNELIGIPLEIEITGMSN